MNDSILESTLKTLLENTGDANTRDDRLLLLELTRDLVTRMPYPDTTVPGPADMLVLAGYSAEGGSKIQAIKALRSISFLGLKEAKNAVEASPIVLLPVDHPRAALVQDVMTDSGASVSRMSAMDCENGNLPTVEVHSEEWGRR